MHPLDQHIGAVISLADERSRAFKIRNASKADWVSTIYIIARERWDRFDPSRGSVVTFLRRVVVPRATEELLRSVGTHKGMDGPRGSARSCWRTPVLLASDVSEHGLESLPNLRWATIPTQAGFVRAQRRRAYRRSQRADNGCTSANR